MSDNKQTKAQLISELEELRQKLSGMVELQEREEKYRVLVEQTNDGAIIIQEGIVKFVNLQMAETLGYAVDEMGNTNFLDYVHPDDHAMVLDLYTRRIRGEDVPNIYELDGLHKNGSKVEIEINSGVGSFQGKPATIAFFRDTTERKKAEAALQKSEERFRTLFEDSTDAYLILQDNIFVDCNQATVEMLRANSKEEVLSTHPSELSPEFQPDGQSSAIKADEMIRIALEKGSNRFEWMHHRVDGEDFPVEVLLTPIAVGGETIIHTAWRDITERNRAEEALKKSEERFRGTLENMLEGCQIIDFDWRYTFINDTAVVHGRVSREDKIGRTMMEVYPDIENTALFTALQLCMKNRTPHSMENQFTYPDGKNGWFDLRIIPVPQGIFLFSIDITERKQVAEVEKRQRVLSEALRDTAEALNSSLKLDDILEKILDNVAQVVHYDAMTVAWVEDGQLSVLRSRGYDSENEIIEYQQKFPQRKFATFAQVIETRQPLVIPDVRASSIWVTSPFTKWVRSHLKVPIVIDKNVVGLINLHNKIPGFYNDTHAGILQTFANQVAIAANNAMLYDDLEERVMERTAELEEANRELESFSYSISHDLRAPLRAINGFSEILAKDFTDKLDEEGLGFLNKIRDASLRMDQLINGLLNLSQLGRQSVEFESLDLFEMVGKIAENLNDSEPDREIDIQLHPCDSILPLARGDRNLIEILLTNLLSNAVKFTRDADPEVVEFGCTVKDGESIYFVRDNGVGFDMAYAEKMFSPFQRLHSDMEYEGMGIGLALVQQVIRRHNGKIWVEAETGKGATFYFTLVPLL